MKTERRNAATRQNVGSKEIKKNRTKQRTDKRMGNYGGTRNIKIILLSVYNEFLL